jgi:hypothetical protein
MPVFSRTPLRVEKTVGHPTNEPESVFIQDDLPRHSQPEYPQFSPSLPDWPLLDRIA